MKIQCSCGAKYELEVLPEMATRPIRFVCSACGLDASEFVNTLVRQELAESTPPPPVGMVSPPAPSPVPVAAAGAVPVGVLLDSPAPAEPAQLHTAPRMRVSSPGPSSPAPAAAEPTGDSASMCLKHGEYYTNKCFVCAKPICPKCMETLGYICSPLCKARADSRGLRVPVYEFQRDVVEARNWRKVVRVISVALAAVGLFVAAWIWYAWFGQVPKPAFSIRFPEMAYSGSSFITGKNNDQIIFIHGGTLARYDMKTKKQIWARELLDTNQIAADALKEVKEMEAEQNKVRAEHPDALDYFQIPSLDKLTKQMLRWAAAEHSLFVHSNNIWVSTYTNLVRYDWDNGNPLKEMPFNTRYANMSVRANDLLLIETESNCPVVTRINLSSCETRVEDYRGGLTNGAPQISTPDSLVARHAHDDDMAGLPTIPGKDMGKPLDPAKVAEQVRHLPTAAKIALPAVLAGTMSQERALSEMNDSEPVKKHTSLHREKGETISFIPSREGYVQVGVTVVDSKIEERSAMKAAPTTSVVNGNLTTGNTLEAANETLNEMQRARGGDTVYEDVSRYRVTLRNPGEEAGWTGEVTGPPELFPLETINVLAAGKSIIVFDKSFKKVWEGNLSFPLSGGISSLDPEASETGQGPCVERNNCLYLFDQGGLTAFELATGKLRWHLPSVGITGMFFDDSGSMYVNTTSANLDSIRYTRQINLTSRVDDIVMKIDCRKGKIIWRAEPGGMVNYVSGKFVYVVSEYQPYDEEEDMGPLASSGLSSGGKPYVRIRRINPRSGTVMWEHMEQRCPVDVQFDKNIIRLVFRKEVEVLKSLAF